MTPMNPAPRTAYDPPTEDELEAAQRDADELEEQHRRFEAEGGLAT